MNGQLRIALASYRDYSINLVEALEKDKFDVLEELLAKRQEVIEKINLLDYEAEEFADICSEYRLSQLEQKLTSMTKSKLDSTKKSMDNFQDRKTATHSYNRMFNSHSVFLNKKI